MGPYERIMSRHVGPNITYTATHKNRSTHTIFRPYCNF